MIELVGLSVLGNSKTLVHDAEDSQVVSVIAFGFSDAPISALFN